MSHAGENIVYTDTLKKMHHQCNRKEQYRLEIDIMNTSQMELFYEKLINELNTVNKLAGLIKYMLNNYMN